MLALYGSHRLSQPSSSHSAAVCPLLARQPPPSAGRLAALLGNTSTALCAGVTTCPTWPGLLLGRAPSSSCGDGLHCHESLPSAGWGCAHLGRRPLCLQCAAGADPSWLPLLTCIAASLHCGIQQSKGSREGRPNVGSLRATWTHATRVRIQTAAVAGGAAPVPPRATEPAPSLFEGDQDT